MFYIVSAFFHIFYYFEHNLTYSVYFIDDAFNLHIWFELRRLTDD